MYKATNVMTVEEIDKYCKEIQPFIEAEYNADVTDEVIARANTLEAYMALTGKMTADSKYRYNEVLSSVFIEAVKEGNKSRMQTSTLNKYIDTLCRDYQHLVDWSDRINRTITHELDFARTIISKIKEEMKMNNYISHI